MKTKNILNIFVVIFLLVVSMSLISAYESPVMHNVSIIPNSVDVPTILSGYCNTTDTDSSTLYARYLWRVNGAVVENVSEFIRDTLNKSYVSTKVTQSICMNDNYILVTDDISNSFFLYKSNMTYKQNASPTAYVSWNCDVYNNNFYAVDSTNNKIRIYNGTTLVNFANITSTSAAYGIKITDGLIYASGGKVRVFNATNYNSIRNFTGFASVWNPFVYQDDDEHVLYLASVNKTSVWNITYNITTSSYNFTFIANKTSGGRHFGAFRFQDSDWWGVYGDNYQTGRTYAQVNIFNATTNNFAYNVSLRSGKAWSAFIDGYYVYLGAGSTKGSYMGRDDKYVYNMTYGAVDVLTDTNFIYIVNENGDLYKTNKYNTGFSTGNTLIDTITSASFNDEDNVTLSCNMTDSQGLVASGNDSYYVDLLMPEITHANLYTDSGNNYSIEDVNLNLTMIYANYTWQEWKLNNVSNLLVYYPCEFNNTYPKNRAQTGSVYDMSTFFTVANT
jgi:hypothetical protein